MPGLVEGAGGLSLPGAVCHDGSINEGIPLKPKGSILIVSMLVMMISCAAGVVYELKPQSTAAVSRLIHQQLFEIQWALADREERLSRQRAIARSLGWTR